MQRENLWLADVITSMLDARPREDWKAYYRSFCEAHGSFPMVDGNKLLFPDGWAYSSTSYEGPEWPPPEDGAERAALIRDYWRLRQEQTKEELLALEEHLRQMEIAQSSRSCPIMFKVVRRDPETGKREKVTQALDLDALRAQRDAIREDLELCEDMLM